MNKIISEFKNFAIKGSMTDMAVGIIIGTAFGNVVNTLVSKILMPPLSLLTSRVSLANKQLVLREAAEGGEEIALGYGAMIEVLVDFMIIALAIFLLIRFLNRMRARAEDPSDTKEVTPKNIELLSSLEELMKEQNQLLRDRRPS